MTEPAGRSPSIVLSRTAIARRVRALARELEDIAPADEPLHLIGVLKGAFVFLADLVRALRIPVTLDFVAVASYGQAASTSGEVRLVKDLETSIAGRHVVLVEDILDTGLTLAYLLEILRARQPRSLRTVCLLSKPSRRVVHVSVEHVGFTIDDRFVVGYGLDWNEQFRHLPHLAVIDGGG